MQIIVHKNIVKWFRFHVLGIGKCKFCRGTGNGKPFGDSELLGLDLYFDCEDCNGTGRVLI